METLKSYSGSDEMIKSARRIELIGHLRKGAGKSSEDVDAKNMELVVRDGRLIRCK
jgi:hypothetical protein